MRIGCVAKLAKYCLIGLAVILAVNIIWILISPLLPTIGSDPRESSTSKKPLPGTKGAESSTPKISPDDMEKADQATQEKGRRGTFDDGGYLYTLGVNENIDAEGRQILTATIERQAGEDVFWTAISRQYSRLEVSGSDGQGVVLNPIRIEGAADLDKQIDDWKTLTVYDVVKVLDKWPAERRDISLKTKETRLIFRAPDGFHLRPGGWGKIFLVGWTNRTITNSDKWREISKGVKNLPAWNVDLYIPSVRPDEN